MNSKFGLLLDTKKFSLEDQFLFARLSGDFNPIHIDKIFSRRTLYGQCIVHGVHASMWAVDSLIKKIGINTSSFKCKFKKPIFLEEYVSCYWNDSNNKLTIAMGDIEFTSISIDTLLAPVENINHEDFIPLPHYLKPTLPIDLAPINCLIIEKNQEWISSGEIKLAKSLFPDFCKKNGLYLVFEISTLSKIVGMQCPGLHSLFASLNIKLIAQCDIRYFKVTNFDARFNKVDIYARGHLISATIEAFFRPQPTKSETIFQLSKLVDKNEFSNVNALIIGGSRGIGEVVSKLICAGGGNVTLTYNVGLDDAKNLASEIQVAGGICNYIQYSIQSPLHDASFPSKINQIYYFASPKILFESPTNNNESLISTYHKFYIKSFKEICDYFSIHSPGCSIFYPSTIYIEQPALQFASYINAKLLGEKICNEQNLKKVIRVISNRLPRLPSDQNQSIILENLPDISKTILPIIRAMSLKPV